MCFSMSADVIAGVALLPVAAVCLREVRTPRELPFASLPLIFALHQLTEALVWHGADDYVSAGVQHAAAMVYVLVAFPLLPFLVPLAVLLLEPQGLRQRVAPFVVLGAVVAAYLLYAVLDGPLLVREEPHALVYDVDLTFGPMWAVLYIVAVIGPSVLSGYPSIVAFGLLNLVGLTVVAIVYVQAFASLWCVWAALTSSLIAVHMVLRRRLPDFHRLEGQALAPA
ncbi:hypothetical protein IBJ60_03290 [Nocardioides sp. zg-578]|nr:hypothetical protein [Nocardioides marmotae]MTB83357.1 hypothetical protein [Nocardioides marmotae]